MGIDATVLGSRNSPTSQSMGHFVHLVSFKSGTTRLLTNRFLICGSIPRWKCLINKPLTADERISLIADIFSNRSETEAVKRLRGDDAQSFVDAIDEVPAHSFILEGRDY